MGDPKGFIKSGEKRAAYRPVCERVKDFGEVSIARTEDQSEQQASRCMDCGTPFCHWGCPVGNYIPEWNDFLFKGQWKKAFQLLEATNNLPEITGRVCPAPCEHACVLSVNDDPVTVRENELDIIEYAFEAGLIKARKPQKRTGKKVAVIGSGPAGLSCAAQLNRAGHEVVVYERDDKAGGILRYGIPDFKLEKRIIDRRLTLMKEAGIKFITSVNVGEEYDPGKLVQENDAICLAIGARQPRDLEIEGRDLAGIHFAMDYLMQSNKRISEEIIAQDELIDAKGKKVVVIGGGDTGSDCVGTANRQGASCVVQIEVMPRPQECRTEDYPWPVYPLLLKTTSSHEEGGDRHWAVLTKKFIGKDGSLKKMECTRVQFGDPNGKGCPVMKELPDSKFEIEADLALLAIGFLRPEQKGLLSHLGLEIDGRGNVKTDDDFMTSKKKVFAAGDMHRGQSLIVWAISEGRKAAHGIDKYLMGKSELPTL